MSIPVEKISGGLSVDGLEFKNGKCGCTSVAPCCYSWSKTKQSGKTITYRGKTTGPDAKDVFTWSFIVKKDDLVVDVAMEDCRDKEIFAGYYPPPLEAFIEKGWELVSKEGAREDFNLWRCAACRWLYKEAEQPVKFSDLPDDWKCPVCKAGKDSFEQAG